jgi:hypothetical protein
VAPVFHHPILERVAQGQNSQTFLRSFFGLMWLFKTFSHFLVVFKAPNLENEFEKQYFQIAPHYKHFRML